MSPRLLARAARTLLPAAALALIAAACSQGLVVEDEPGTRPLTSVSILFDDSPGAEFKVGPSEREEPAPSRATEPPPAQTSPLAGPAQPQIDTSLISENPVASAIAVPAATLDPGLLIVGESSDPAPFVAPELIRDAGLESYFVSGSERQVSDPSAADGPRPIRVFQEVFVHTDSEQAQTFYELLRNQSAPSRADAAVDGFRAVYPDLEPTFRATDQFGYASQTQLIEVRIDPRVEDEERALGPGDPHVYYLALQEGRVTALFEITYLAQQNPAAVALMVERLVQRIPPELREAETP